MNPTIFILLFSLTTSLSFVPSDSDILRNEEVVKLPPPATTGGAPFNEILMKRRTRRDFLPDQSMTLQQLSQALWTAYGVNRPESGMRVVPTAIPHYSITIYVFLKEGIYKYEAIKHELIKIKDGDFRKETGPQDFVKDACADLAFVCDLNTPHSPPVEMERRKTAAHRDSSHMSQDLYLYCASEDFKCVVRGNFENDKVLNAIGLDLKAFYVPLTYSIGK